MKQVSTIGLDCERNEHATLLTRRLCFSASYWRAALLAAWS